MSECDDTRSQAETVKNIGRIRKNYGGDDMSEQTNPRASCQLRLIKAKEKLFSSVKLVPFRCNGRYQYKATSKSGRFVIITIDQLFSPTQMGRKIYDLTGDPLLMPHMNRVEYHEFIQEFVDNVINPDESPSAAEQRQMRIFWRAEVRSDLVAEAAQGRCSQDGDNKPPCW